MLLCERGTPAREELPKGSVPLCLSIQEARGLRRFPFRQRAVSIGNLEALGYA
jgi:hypothetical protein